MQDDRPQDLGINVADKITTQEKVGPAVPEQKEGDTVFEVNAIGVFTRNEDGTFSPPTCFTYLKNDKSKVEIKKGLRYQWNFKIEVR